jgi:membrane protein
MFKTIWELLKGAAVEWDKDKCPRLGAALSYYTLFSLAPVLVIAIAIAGMIFGDEAARGQIVGQIQGLVGSEGAKAIQAMLENADKPGDSILATVAGFVMLMIGATGAFVELQDSLNTVWEVMPKPGRGIMGLIKDRLLSFGVVLGVGFLLLVSLVLSAGLTAVSSYLGDALPGSTALWQIVNLILSFAVVAVLFAMMFKILPDVELDWEDVWVGAVVTSFLFTVGKYLIGLYLGNSSIASSYGAAGSVVVLLVWVYYTSQILLFGAEFTQVYAERFGVKIAPSKHAMSISTAYCDRETAKTIAKNVVEDVKEGAEKSEVVENPPVGDAVIGGGAVSNGAAADGAAANGGATNGAASDGTAGNGAGPRPRRPADPVNVPDFARRI